MLEPWHKTVRTQVLESSLLPPHVCISRKEEWVAGLDLNSDTLVQHVGI